MITGSATELNAGAVAHSDVHVVGSEPLPAAGPGPAAGPQARRNAVNGDA
jgi:hypothetical protein